MFALTITETATTKLKELISKHAPETGAYLRVYVAGGGCSGMSYGMALDEQLKDGDEIVHNNGIKVVVDEKSLAMLDGATVDWVESVQGTGFAISNTNNWSTCGCGKSFSPKGEAAPDAGAGHHEGGHEGHNH